MIPKPDSVCIPFEIWRGLDEEQQQFLIDAEKGCFRYLVEDGEVFAWGATKTGNLFSMEVIEGRGAPGEGVYMLPAN